MILRKRKESLKTKKFVDDEKYLHKRKHRKTDRSLGLGDLMILFILQIQWSLLTKILVIFGCIISSDYHPVTGVIFNAFCFANDWQKGC
jgi:hypothetical protein